MAKDKSGTLILVVFLLLPLFMVLQESQTQEISFTDDWTMARGNAAHTSSSASSLSINLVPLWNFTGAHSLSEVTVANGFAYFSWNYAIYALNASNGQLMWHTAGSSVSFLQTPSPAIADGIVYTATDAFNASTGQLLFNYTNCEGSTSPVFYNGTIFLGTNMSNIFAPGGIVAVNAKTGEKSWGFTGEEGQFWYGGMVQFPPAIAGGVAYFSCGGGLYALNAQNGNVLWRSSSIDPTLGSKGCVASDNNRIFDCVGDTVYCMGSSSWSAKVNAFDDFPAFNNGTVYIGSCALDGTNGKILWNNSLTQLSSPVIAGDVVYCGHYYYTTEGSHGNWIKQEVLGIDASTGQIVWNYTFPGVSNLQIGGYISIAKGILYASEPSGIYAFSVSSKPANSQPASNLNSIILSSMAIIAAVILLILIIRHKRKKPKSYVDVNLSKVVSVLIDPQPGHLCRVP
jgi:outer membrane protein assembly factor BamB